MLCVDIYCRVSTDIQEDNTSLEEQEAAGRITVKHTALQSAWCTAKSGPATSTGNARS